MDKVGEVGSGPEKAAVPAKIGETTGSDLAAMLLRGTLGAIPLVGPLAAEIATGIIPRQRIDRIQAFLEKLAETVGKMDAEFVKQRMTCPKGVDLLEDCVDGAVKALSGERIGHLASLYAVGITTEQADHETNKKMVLLLNQLTDAEVVWLAELAQGRSAHDRPERNAEILAPRAAYFGSPVEDLDAQAIQKAWKDRLIQLGLAKESIRSPLEFEKIRGDWKRHRPEATWLGRMLLRYIGIAGPSGGDTQ